MAVRPVFKACEAYPYSRKVDVEFTYNQGFAVSQKQKNIKAIHEGYGRIFPGEKVLEISSKSMQEGGESLSAFFLPKFVPSLGKSVPLENVYQSAKTYEHDGPFPELLTVSPKDAKHDERHQTSGKLMAFTFECKEYPTLPITAFYDFMYITAVRENPQLHDILMQYDAFTDIEFNPNKSLNCQAKAAASYVSLVRTGLIDKCDSFDSFLKLMNESVIAPVADAAIPIPKAGTTLEPEPEKKQDTKPMEGQDAPAITSDTVFVHKIFGEGKGTLDAAGKHLKVSFPIGEKTFIFPQCLTLGFLKIK